METQLINKLERFIDNEFTYRYGQNPDVVRDEEDARRNGINCVTLAHFAIKEIFGIELPRNLLCAELYANREYFEYDRSINALQLGDLVWFGIENPKIEPENFKREYVDGQLVNWRDFAIKHVAVSIGEQDTYGDDLLLHSTYYEGTNVVWPLTRFATYGRYERTYGMSRIKSN